MNSQAIAEEKEPNGKHVPEQAGPFPDLKVWFSSLTKETRPDIEPLLRAVGRKIPEVEQKIKEVPIIDG